MFNSLLIYDANVKFSKNLSEFCECIYFSPVIKHVQRLYLVSFFVFLSKGSNITIYYVIVLIELA